MVPGPDPHGDAGAPGSPFAEIPPFSGELVFSPIDAAAAMDRIQALMSATLVGVLIRS